MPKRFPKNAILAVAIGAGCALFGANAFATPELMLTSGAATPVTVIGSPGFVSYSNSNFDGWNITFVNGVSNSPTTNPFGVDIGSLIASCNGGGCLTDTLTVEVSDTGFTTPVGTNGFVNSYSLTGSSGSPSTTQAAFFDTTDTIFGQGGTICSVTLTSTNGKTCQGGGPAGPSPYSLTLVDTFAPGAGSYSSDGNIITIKVPEPASLLLLGTGLLGFGFFVRRKNRA